MNASSSYVTCACVRVRVSVLTQLFLEIKHGTLGWHCPLLSPNGILNRKEV